MSAQAGGQPGGRSAVRSLRVRVPLTAMTVFVISLAVAALLAYELLLRDARRDIDVMLDRELQRFGQSVAGLLDDERLDDPEAAPEQLLEGAVRRYLQLNPGNASYWTIVTFSDGRRLAASNGPPVLEPLFRARVLPAGELNERQTLDTGTTAGQIRTTAVPLLMDDEQIATLQVVSPLGPERADAREATLLVAAAAGVSLLVGGVLLAASLWRSLTPLGALAQAARSTELRALARRVEVPDSGDEVATLAHEFNTMLDRIDVAAARERTFMSSVGHELRTPITIARGHLELLTGDEGADPEAVAETVGIVRDELGRMSRLVDDLMAIARAEMEDFIRPREVDVVAWFEELELKLRGVPGAERVRVDPPPALVVRADPDRLAQAVLNLVNNAVVHTPPDTTIRVMAELEGAELAITVVDDGPGIPEEIRGELFAPFVRASELPSSTGLGLSVVKAVVDAHGGDVRLATGPDGTRVDLLLPVEPPPGEPPDASPAASERLAPATSAEA